MATRVSTETTDLRAWSKTKAHAEYVAEKASEPLERLLARVVVRLLQEVDDLKEVIYGDPEAKE